MKMKFTTLLHHRIPSICLIAGLAFGVTGCEKDPEPPAAPIGAVAVANGEVILPDEISFPSGETDLAARRERVDEAILSVVAASRAKALALDDSPDVRDRLDRIHAEAKRLERETLQDALYQHTRAVIEPTEAEIEAHYSENARQYAVRQIIVERTVYANREVASMALIGEGTKPAGTSVEKLGPLPIAELPPSVLPEASRLIRVGQRALAEGNEGEWAVIELMEVDRARPRPLSEVRDRVREGLVVREASKRWNALLVGLREDAAITINESVLRDSDQWRGSRARPGAGEVK